LEVKQTRIRTRIDWKMYEQLPRDLCIGNAGDLYGDLHACLVFVISLSRHISAGETVPRIPHPGRSFSGLRNEKGKVLCALYSSPDGFPKKADNASAHVTADISERHATCRFSGVTPGTYAVSVFHDENSNGKLDTSFMGIPREGVGASNNARGHFGPPKFEAAAFQFTGGRLELKITLTYL